jgi:hypothetical protein
VTYQILIVISLFSYSGWEGVLHAMGLSLTFTNCGNWFCMLFIVVLYWPLAEFENWHGTALFSRTLHCRSIATCKMHRIPLSKFDKSLFDVFSVNYYFHKFTRIWEWAANNVDSNGVWSSIYNQYKYCPLTVLTSISRQDEVQHWQHTGSYKWMYTYKVSPLNTLLVLWEDKRLHLSSFIVLCDSNERLEY